MKSMDSTDQNVTFNVELTAAERQLLCNAGKWCLIYKPSVCGGKDLERVQGLWKSIRDKLGAGDEFI